MKIQNWLLVSFLIVGTQVSQAGWITFGGENSIYARNPWFAKNTLVVPYCVEMDEPSFSISKAQVLNLINEALVYWKTEFATNFAANTKPGFGFAEVATQDFKYQSTCSPTTPLIFKLGSKTLSDKEKEHLGDVGKYIGATIRKDYSLKDLKADGIIYITSDLGPDAYPNPNGLLIDKAWTRPALFRYALIHEIGHLFGIPHVGAGIMSEVFMTILLNKSMAPEFQRASQQSFLNPPRDFEVCRLTGQFNPDFFKASPGTTCLKFARVATGALEWTVFSRADSLSPDIELGTVQALTVDQSPYSLKPAVMLQLPDEQTVFTSVATIARPYLIGAVFSDVSYSGAYRLKGQIRSHPVHMTLSADKVSFVGAINNQQLTVMSYAPLSFLKAIFP